MAINKTLNATAREDTRKKLNKVKDLPIAQAVSRWLRTAAARVYSRSGHVGFTVEKWHWGKFSSSTSVCPANRHSPKFPILTTSRGRYNMPIVCRRAECTQLGGGRPPPRGGV
jgi:hypothetical protein